MYNYDNKTKLKLREWYDILHCAVWHEYLYFYLQVFWRPKMSMDQETGVCLTSSWHWSLSRRTLRHSEVTRIRSRWWAMVQVAPVSATTSFPPCPKTKVNLTKLHTSNLLGELKLECGSSGISLNCTSPKNITYLPEILRLFLLLNLIRCPN